MHAIERAATCVRYGMNMSSFLRKKNLTCASNAKGNTGYTTDYFGTLLVFFFNLFESPSFSWKANWARPPILSSTFFFPSWQEFYIESSLMLIMCGIEIYDMVFITL
ncbi:hypothetical protein KFK09_025186 [Dendrobium nobile]|uniref:Uncharacterized protein n=1 Tax=Dendrobium nobile TaxID=94219 RepID=A0A8T3AFQ1_DENNO|nr:hypothetical protein KFK09_025186 [Dendrobium nobile]